jgi:hypothetical protein
MKYRLNEKATVYSAASSTSLVVAELRAGDELNVGEGVTNGDEKWDGVKLPDGKTGYIPARTKASKVGSKPTSQSIANVRKKRVTHISIHQTSKVLAILYVAIGLLFIPIGVLLILSGNMGMGIVYVLMPFIYGIIGYPLVAVMCWAYNLIVKNVGGVEFTVEDETDVA